MATSVSDKRPQFVEALEACRAIFFHGPRDDYAQWQRDARAAVQWLYDLKEKSQSGGVELGISLPWQIQLDLIDFINGDLQRAYLWNDVASITALPAPAAWRHKLDEFIEDLGGQKTPAAQSESDGPVPPNGFRWAGKVHLPLAKGPFSALAAAWPENGHCIHKDDLATALGDSEETLPDSSMPSIRGELNEFFTFHNIPLHAKVRGLFLAIQDGAPRGSAGKESSHRKPTQRRARR